MPEGKIIKDEGEGKKERGPWLRQEEEKASEARTEEQERVLSPEQKAELETRKAEIERKVEKVKAEEEIPQEEVETVESIVRKAREKSFSWTVASTESMARTLADLTIHGNETVDNVFRAAKKFDDPYFFDYFITALTTDEAWGTLKANNKI